MPVNTKIRNIPFFDYPNAFSRHKQEILKVTQEVLERGAFILQKDLERFEKHVAEYIGAKYVIGVANGTDSLILALKAAGLGHGDEVIFCSHTYVATAAAIKLVGAIPVPAECGADHLIDPQSVKKAVTAKTKAIMPTQLNGRTCDMDALQAIADQHDLVIIEDSAQALGSQFKGKFAGTFGLAGSFSFYPAKILGCLGDGGCVITNDDSMAEKIYQLRDHGRNSQGEIVTWGYNSRLDNLQAAVLEVQFKDYQTVIERRRELATQYQTQLENIPPIKLPPAPGSDPRHYDVYQNYEIQAENRDALKKYLADQGIGTLIQWGGKAVHQWKALGFKVNLPVTEAMTSQFLMLPMNMMISNDDVNYIAETIKTFYQ